MNVQVRGLIDDEQVHILLIFENRRGLFPVKQLIVFSYQIKRLGGVVDSE